MLESAFLAPTASALCLGIAPVAAGLAVISSPALDGRDAFLRRARHAAVAFLALLVAGLLIPHDFDATPTVLLGLLSFVLFVAVKCPLVTVPKGKRPELAFAADIGITALAATAAAFAVLLLFADFRSAVSAALSAPASALSALLLVSAPAVADLIVICSLDSDRRSFLRYDEIAAGVFLSLLVAGVLIPHDFDTAQVVLLDLLAFVPAALFAYPLSEQLDSPASVLCGEIAFCLAMTIMFVSIFAIGLSANHAFGPFCQ